MSERNRIAFIDVMALTYKAYFAFIKNPLRAKRTGEPTSAVFGFLTQLIKLISDLHPEALIAVTDSKEKTFRHERYPKYKSSRLAMPDDMIPQLSRLQQLLEAFRIPLFAAPGWEADDIIGTLARKAEDAGWESLLVTPDKDYNQLITKHTVVIKPGRSSDELDIIDTAAMQNLFGFAPLQMIDYLALTGDKSDDIPGVKGIGEKTAIPLIQKYTTVENIYENIQNIQKEATQKKLLDGKDDAFLSKELVTIALNVPVTLDFEKAMLVEPDYDRLEAFCEELEFFSMAKKIRSVFGGLNTSAPGTQENAGDTFTGSLSVSSKDSSAITTSLPSISLVESVSPAEVFQKENVKYTLITDETEAKALAELLAQQPAFVFDTETNGLDPFTLHAAGVSFCIKPGEAFFIAVNPEKEQASLFETSLEDRLPISVFCKLFAPVFENETIKKICQNGKYDLSVLRKYGIRVKNFSFDTMIAGYLLDPDQKLNMDALSLKYLNYAPIPLKALIGEKKDAKKIFDVDLEALSNYACEDADITYRLYDLLKDKLHHEEMDELADTVEFPLVEVLEAMEAEGFRIDEEALLEFGRALEIKMREYEEAIHNAAGEIFNVNSPKQLQVILFEKLGLTPPRKTKTGFSTDAQTLEYLQNDHPIVRFINDYRQVAKLKSTYADALITYVNPQTGRVHTSFNQTVTATGRLSSNNPNLQNIPIRTELGREIRKAFIPRDKNHTLLSFDYSQIELRIMASLSGDEHMRQAFLQNEDIHRSTASKVFRVPFSEVTPEMRRKAKEVNFGIMYGIGPFGLKTRLGISQSEAAKLIKDYFALFSSVQEYIQSTIEKAKSNGYSETLLKRRRYLLNINSKNKTVAQAEARIAINMPIQGTAADMIKLAMVSIYRALGGKFKTKMILQVHDELIFDVPKEELDEVIPIIKSLMENAFPLSVPVVAEYGHGVNWLKAH